MSLYLWREDGCHHVRGHFAIFPQALYWQRVHVYRDSHRFMQDNDPKHTSRLASQFFEDNGINWWRTPAESPDCNPIENLWHDMKGYLRREVKPETKQQLIDGTQLFWTTAYLQTLLCAVIITVWDTHSWYLPPIDAKPVPNCPSVSNNTCFQTQLSLNIISWHSLWSWYDWSRSACSWAWYCNWCTQQGAWAIWTTPHIYEFASAIECNCQGFATANWRSA